MLIMIVMLDFYPLPSLILVASKAEEYGVILAEDIYNTSKEILVVGYEFHWIIAEGMVWCQTGDKTLLN